MGAELTKAAGYAWDITPFAMITGIGSETVGITDLPGMIGKFLELFVSIIRVGIGLVDLVKEIFMGGIVFVKSMVDVILDAFEIIMKITEFIEYISFLVTKYLHMPFVFVYFIPFFLLSNYYLTFVNTVIDKI